MIKKRKIPKDIIQKIQKWSDVTMTDTTVGYWNTTDSGGTNITPSYPYTHTIAPSFPASYAWDSSTTIEMNQSKTKIGDHVVSKFVSLKEMDDRIIITLEDGAGDPFNIHINNNRPKNTLTEIRAFINECEGDCPGCLFRQTCMSGAYYLPTNSLCYDNGGDIDDMEKVLNNMAINNGRA